ncbi:hypothetical protein [Rhodococcus sp. (in: high G+C Gram-positive bacteria)]|jgi:hypothetical protein|uniref:hypothetical protein n=1 Tax=Rhodococcus TaxID=1827 RepID=UPI00331509D7
MTDLPPRVTELVFAELLVPAHVLGAATGGYRSAVCDAAGEPTNVVDFEPVSRRWIGRSVWGTVAVLGITLQETLASGAFACHAVEL